LIFFLAARNVIRNWRKSLVVLLLFLAVNSLFFLGNSILEQSNRGLKETFIENFTGDLVVKSRSETDFGIFGANTPSIGEYFSIPVLKDYDSLLEVVEFSPYIRKNVSQVSGAASMKIAGRSYNVPLFGVEGDDYFSFFDSLELIEGELITTGEEGILLTVSRIDQIERETGTRPEPGDPVLLTMVGRTGFKIREVPLKGIFSYKNSNESMDQILLVDVQTLRALNSITLASEREALSEDDLFSGSIDDLFSVSDVEGEESRDFSAESVLDLLNQTADEESGDLIGGGWNFILLDVKEGVSDRKVMEELNRAFNAEGLDVEVVNWRDAAGMTAALVSLLQIFFNGGFLLVLVAGVIAIVNILVISIFERTGEIGTLRAIGASKSYITLLFFLENMILALTAAFLSLLFSYVIFQLINRAGVPINNSLMISLLGMKQIHVTFMPSVALISVLTSILTGVLSIYFPLSLAVKIEPAAAVSRT